MFSKSDKRVFFSLAAIQSFLAMVAIAWLTGKSTLPSSALAATVDRCIDFDGFVDLDCMAPEAYRCLDDAAGPEDQTGCFAIGFTEYQGHLLFYGKTGWGCPGGIGACGMVEVPELEDHAMAAFLVLALTIGWRARRHPRST